MTLRKAFRWSLAVVLSLLGMAEAHATTPLELASWLESDMPLWAQSAERLVAGPPPVFAWADPARGLARAPDGACTFRGLRSWESTLRVRNDRPVGLEAVLYERGDAGELTRDAFFQLVREAVVTVERWAGSPGQKATDELRSTGIKREALTWVKDGTRIRLTASHSTKDREGSFAFRAEYVRLVCEPVTGDAPNRPAPPPVARRAEARANGDLVLAGIPMVDQGEKGYCSVATVERITRYLGLAVDQHQLAQLAASDPSGGTDVHFLVDALQRVGPRIGLRARVLEELKLDDVTRLIERYNREARRAGQPAVAAGRVIDLADVYRQMDFALLREARNKDGGGRKAFLGDVQKAIAEGVPLVWGVVLGKVAERPAIKGLAGGHMRLIIGCNPRTGEILYSDSWGPGHEEKRMPLEDAWAISVGRYRIEAR
jgi:hypothetical protein